MIVSMKHLDLVCLASCREATLRRLRALGVVHLDLVSSSGTAVIDAKAKLSDAERAVRIIRKARTEEVGDVRARSVEEVLAIDADRETLKTERDRLEREINLYEPFGDFDPVLAKELLLKVEGLADVVTLPEKLPSMRLSRLREKYERVVNRINIDTEKLAICDDMAILSSFPSLADSMAFEQAKELLQDHGAVCVISGWVPVTKLSNLMEEVRSSKGDLFDRANSLGWGVLVRDPAEGETPPTLVEPPKLFRPVKALFEGLGIAPGYTEADVSVPFMCYFSLFFAMLVGDGAYGGIFLAATLWGWKKYRASKGNALMKSWLVMLTVFSASTVIWGLLSNTWFGAQIPYFNSWPTVKWLADPSYNNMMLLCFTIGVSHLMLARIWNGICKINDTTSIAEFGWAGILLFMYFVTNSIVGIFSSIPHVMFYVFGFSLVAVFAFTVKPSEFKSRGAEIGMLPLNIMSALGDIISYVRLFAVGLASVKVAENFNSMAIGLVSGADEWWLKAFFSLLMVLILILGHALNLVMAGLSILVHAVRLNTLEFSNHKGISWAGYAFKPFRKTKEK